MKFLLTLLLFSTYCLAGQKTIKIALVDTGLDLKDTRFSKHVCSSGHKDFTGTGLKDTQGHGTHVAGIIQKNAGDGNYCFLIYKYFTPFSDGRENLELEIKAFKQAIQDGADIVNFSAGGPKMDEDERSLILNNPQVRFVVAAGNENTDLDNDDYYYPACYGFKNIFSVGSLAQDKTRSKSSNYGKIIKFWEVGEKVYSTLPDGKYGYLTGTSQAAAVFSGKLIKRMIK